VSAGDAIAALGLPPGRRVDVGGPVHYREWPGPGSGPTFVMVHGLGGSLLNWAPVAPALAATGRVLALDLAGFGLTPLAGRGASVLANSRLVDAFLATLDLPPVVMVGNSMGGMITLLQAARRPESLEAMVLVDAALPRARAVAAQPSPRVAALFAMYAAGRAGEELVRRRVRRLGPEGLVRETLRISAADPSTLDPGLVAAHVELVRRRAAVDDTMPAFLEAARSIFRSQALPARYRAVVRSVRVPALVLHGALDRLVPVAAAREAVAQHPEWELQVFPDLGHIPQMEAPGRWLEAVTGWLVRAGLTEPAATA
jgi:pimeloyl-ACP methyl ester carboxylesterase